MWVRSVEPSAAASTTWTSRAPSRRLRKTSSPSSQGALVARRLRAQTRRPQNDVFVNRRQSAPKSMSYYTSNEGETNVQTNLVMDRLLWFNPDDPAQDEPRLAVYVRRWHPPGPVLADVVGESRPEEGWPIERIRARTLHPQP